DALQARQDLLHRGNGVALPPAQREVEQRLDSVIERGTGRAGAVEPGPLLPSPQLPASYDDQQLVPHPEPADLAKTLIDRATQGLLAGRTDQARSDLALAQSELEGLPASQLG